MRLHTQNRLKRKKQESEHIQKSAISSVNTKVKSIVIDDIYSDIFEGIGMSSKNNNKS